MEAGYHIASLLALAFFAAAWDDKTAMDIAMKLFWTALAAWGAVIVAKDWFL